MVWKQNRETELICWNLEWPQCNPLSNWNYKNDHLHWLRSTKIWKNYRSKNNWVHSKIVLHSDSKKDDVLTRQEKMIGSHYNNYIDMLKLGCTWRNLANLCLHKPTDVSFYPLTKWIRNIAEEIWEDVASGSLIVFTCKSVFDGYFVEKAKKHVYPSFGLIPAFCNFCRLISPCRLVNPRDAMNCTVRPWQNKIRSFGIMVMF